MRSGVDRFAPNISWLFPEMPFADRLEAIIKLGFKAIEFGFPSQSDLPALEAAHRQDGLQIVLFNQDVPVWDSANRGYLVDPGRRDEFRRKLDHALETAERLDVAKVMLPAGVRLERYPRAVQRQCMLDNLGWASPLADQAGVLLTIEMLNPHDNPGYFLTSTSEGLAIVRELDHPSVRFQFDTYHVQRMEGNLTQTLVDNQDWIGHVQYADVPGRHEPGTGEIRFDHLTEVLTSIGYHDLIGLEYVPQASGSASLDWCLAHGSSTKEPLPIDAHTAGRNQ